MTLRILHPELAFGSPAPYLSLEQSLAWRVRMVLETRPGDLPWRPGFGCDLSGLVGQPATVQHLNEARWRVEEAVRKWIPEAEIRRCHVSAVRLNEGGPLRAPPDAPLAEYALLTLGTQANLEVLLDLTLAGTALTVGAMVEP
ncbi:MAG: GPW/gp25 family protein [Pseudomonadota bacterium]